ncbi:MAG: tyrosine--tRNA ligase [Deltaproteobacteria bacterium]|nr:tyrosine--tRNA ligase [Deltaproteobacteria bacterium]
MSVYDVFFERGFIEQVTDEGLIRELLQDRKINCYIGFDPTATSLHIGSLVPIMALVHMQQHGHRPIALIGGGTGLIGDPSGKTEMRQILTREQINFNAQCLQAQLSKYLDFGQRKALMVNNADWLTTLNYIEFLRDIGRHFSVNKMLSAESYRQRLEKGLNFIEFNYMLLQAYDFLYLFKHQDCAMQMGGNDQWGNMLAGIDLIRRMEGRMAFSLTFPLLTTSQGHKMGKTEKGTVWLDRGLTSPYDYYQYWVNVEDADVERFLALFTFLPMEEVRQARMLVDADLNMAKSVLAFEATKITHGEAEALSAWQAAVKAFHVKPVEAALFPSCTIPRAAFQEEASTMPSLTKSHQDLEKGIPAFELFAETGLCASKGEARRLIAQGGGYVNDTQIKVFDEKIMLSQMDAHGEIRLRKGKKHHFMVRVK